MTRAELRRLARRVREAAAAPPPRPRTEIWLPDNGRDDRGGPYPRRDGVVVIYDPDEPLPPAPGDA